jgi:hypothetical protein
MAGYDFACAVADILNADRLIEQRDKYPVAILKIIEK